MFVFFLRDDAGQGQMEYAVTLGLVVLMVLGALRFLGGKTSAGLQNIANAMPGDASGVRP